MLFLTGMFEALPLLQNQEQRQREVLQAVGETGAQRGDEMHREGYRGS